MATLGDAAGDVAMEPVSPRDKTTMQRTIERSLGAMKNNLDARADPDAQTTVTDFLDFTEYLPSDMIRSLTLIGKLDQTYHDASISVDDLTTTWGQLPTFPVGGRPNAAQLRAEISQHLSRAVDSRTYAYAEAKRMSENLHRHYGKATILLAKLKTLMENYPKEEPKSPVSVKSPQMSRAKAPRAEGDEPKVQKRKIPKITVPGEVLAPYDIEYDTPSEDGDSSSDESEILAAIRTPAVPRIKLVSAANRTPKSANRPPKSAQTSDALQAAAVANLAALQRPPPSDAVIGSPDAPWLQLTDYELAKLRKRMKKNAIWSPSDTMVARELKSLGRGPDAFREAKNKAEEEGQPFEPVIPAPVVAEDSGASHLPMGAMSVDALVSDGVPTSNRGMKLNEAKRIKRDLAKLAAEEAEESAKKMAEQAQRWLGNTETSNKNGKPPKTSRSNVKRRRETDGDINGEGGDGEATPSSGPQTKRMKTETPVLPPQRPGANRSSRPALDMTGVSGALLTPGGTNRSGTPLQTPVPIPLPGSSSRGAISPTPPSSGTITTTVPVKPPAPETPVPLPNVERPAATPADGSSKEKPAREGPRRETRNGAAKRTQQQESLEGAADSTDPPPTDVKATRPASRGRIPGDTPAPETTVARRPGSRGRATSQELLASAASDRPRRASAARITPAPESKQVANRRKRPAPGIVDTNQPGGNSAVGQRKAPPKRKARTKKGQIETEMEEVDDDGNPISPDEPRYCLCNSVSYGTMILCDNEACKHEWFHLDCVGLGSMPARTTKWYCLNCRKALKLGEKGEVSVRGVRR